MAHCNGCTSVISIATGCLDPPHTWSPDLVQQQKMMAKQCLRALNSAPLVIQSPGGAVWQALCSLGSPHWGSHVAAGLSSSSNSSSCQCPRPFSTTSSSNSTSTSTASSSSQSSGSSQSSSGSDTSTSSAAAGGSTTLKKSQETAGRAWQRELRAVRAHVFEHQLGNGQRSGRKAILKPLKGRYIADWYFTLTGPKMLMLIDDVEEERQARVETARATGGGPPKKGQGKRAKK